MKATKIKIKNLFGIKEMELDGKSVELVGETGAGKTSVIDAIKYALTNKSERKYIVRNGETEGEILIETDTGLSINRKPRTNMSDYKMVKENGTEVKGAESFLRDIFTPLQLNPVEFMDMSEKEQNAIILDMIQFDWDMNWIKEQFGEIPRDVNYEQNILAVLNDIQSEKGWYYTHRQDINRDIRNKTAFIEEIADTIPEGYTVEKWENEVLSEIYAQIETIKKNNSLIQKAKFMIESRDNKVRSFEADKEIAIAALDREYETRGINIDREVLSLENRIKELQTEKAGLQEKKADKVAVIESEYKEKVATYDAQVESYVEFADKEMQDTTALEEKAAYTEEMKGHINEYYRMVALQEEVEVLSTESQSLTDKIEHARALPGIILQQATIPINNLTVVDGVPLINGLPINNLSGGERLDLCIDIAVQKPNALQIILIDGVERLSSNNRKELYAKCKAKGLQFIATRVTDDEELTVIEL